MKRDEALKEAVQVLRREANELAMWSMAVKGTTNNPPHRVLLTISMEIDRLRKIADTIEPKTPRP